VAGPFADRQLSRAGEPADDAVQMTNGAQDRTGEHGEEGDHFTGGRGIKKPADRDQLFISEGDSTHHLSSIIQESWGRRIRLELVISLPKRAGKTARVELGKVDHGHG